MLQDFKSEIKVFVIVAAVSAVLAVGGILLLQAMQPTLPPGEQTEEGVTQLYGEAIHKSDVQTIPDSRLSGKIWLLSDLGFESLLETDDLLSISSADFSRLQSIFDEKEVEKYAFGAAIIEDGKFLIGVPHGVYAVCYENLAGVQEGRVSILGCNRGKLETAKMDIAVISSFGAITISGGGGEWEREWTLPSAEELDTSAWQTYRSEEYGFEVRFPVSWRSTIVEDASEYSFTSGGGGMVVFEINVSSDSAFREFAEGLSKAEIGTVIQHEGINYTKKSNSLISGRSAVVYTADRSSIPFGALPIQREVLLVRGDSVFQFWFIGGDQQFNQHRATLERILAFFRFLDIPKEISEISSGVDPRCLTVKFRYDTDIEPPENALPVQLRGEAANIDHNFPEGVLRDVDTSGTLKFWFRITLKETANPINFHNTLARLEYVDSVDFCSLSVPMLIPQ